MTREHRTPRAASRDARGFTLAEVAVTIVIVGIGLVLVLQGLNTAKISAAETRSMKLARELGLLTLGQVESGLYQEDIQTGLAGSYADQGYPEFTYEVAVGDKSFHEKDPNAPFDNFAPTPEEEERKRDDEEIEEPFEKVKVRVTFPKINDLKNELVLERWMAWTQVYGESEDKDQKGAKKNSSTPAQNNVSGGTTPAAGSGGSNTGGTSK